MQFSWMASDPSRDLVVVFEDAPSGVASGKAAGMKTVGLCTSHTKDKIAAAEPDYIVQDLAS